MEQEIPLEVKKMIEEQFSFQIEYSYKRHRKFMLTHGLGKCKTVVDFGTGNGSFLHKLAKDHTEIKFHGIECDKERLRQAKKLAKKYKKIRVHKRDIEKPRDFNKLRRLLNKADGILMRYFILHVTNVNNLLENLASALNENTFLWIFDLDLEYLKCDRSYEATREKIEKVVQSFFDKHSEISPAGSKICDRLEENGFTIMEKRSEPYSNKGIKDGKFERYILNELKLYNYFLDERTESDDINAVEKFFKEEFDPENGFMEYGMSMVGAIKR